MSVINQLMMVGLITYQSIENKKKAKDILGPYSKDWVKLMTKQEQITCDNVIWIVDSIFNLL